MVCVGLALVASGLWVQPRAAQAQSPGVVEVPEDWALVPSGLGVGDEFRLLFRSSTQVDATSGFIGTWNSRAAARAAAGHEAIREHSSLFKVVGSTGSVDARDNIAMNPNNSAHLDVAVYWLGGPRVAANTAGFWGQSWENWSGADCRMEDGAVCTSPSSWPWTGTNGDGTKATQYLGNTPNVRHGSLAMGSNTSGPISKNQVVRTQSRPFFVMSPVFRVQTGAAAVVEVPADWALVPSDVGPGEGFRLLFRTSVSTRATDTDIAGYDAFVQKRAASGHAAIREHSARFQAVGSTAAVDARDHIAMNPTDAEHLDVPVYWLNGAQVAAGSAGFWSDAWAGAARNDCRDQNGGFNGQCNFASAIGHFWTGTNTDGTKHANPLGSSGNVRAGSFRNGKVFSYTDQPRGGNREMLAISPIFQVALPSPEVSASYTQVYEGERKVIVFETSALSVGFKVSALGGLTTNDYRIYSPPDAAVPLLGESWTATASNGLVKFALEGVSDSEADAGEALRVTLTSNGKALGRADIKVRDGERPLSLLFRVRRGSPTEEWVETDRPAVTLHEGGADVSYQIRVSRDAPGYTTANLHISPNPHELYRLDAIRPGPWDSDRFIYRDPGQHPQSDSTSLIVGTGGWKTVTFAAGQDEDAHNHGITLYHRVSPRGAGWSSSAADEDEGVPGIPNYERPEVVGWPVLAGPDSREYSAPSAGLQNELRYARVSPCRKPTVTACWTWPLPVQIVDDDKWEQELVYARHDPGANGGDGGPDGNWVLASDGGLRKALPAVLAPGSTYTFYIRLAVDPATLPKDGTVSRNQPQNYFQNGQLRTRQVDVYPPTFLPDRIPVWVAVKGARKDRHGVPDMRLLVTPNASGGVAPNSGTYFITDTSGTRNHPSVEADYNYRDNTPPGAKGSLLFWDEPMAVTIVVSADAPLGVSGT
ncbi:MAG: hypothetical protein F4Z23_06010 [Acidimicrobiaceae bacterium]|nr:hypothetical protein [Acidimicrobiaceae bacterium]